MSDSPKRPITYGRKVTCDGFECDNLVNIPTKRAASVSWKFCSSCKSSHSYKVLILQATRGKRIKELILESASLYDSAANMADHLGVSRATLYPWLKTYFDMDFQQFKRHYICRAQKCMVIDTSLIPVVWKYHLTQSLKSGRSCACWVNFGDQELMITTAKPDKIREILRNSPETIDDGTGICKVRYPIKNDNLYFDELGIELEK